MIDELVALAETLHGPRPDLARTAQHLSREWTVITAWLTRFRALEGTRSAEEFKMGRQYPAIARRYARWQSVWQPFRLALIALEQEDIVIPEGPHTLRGIGV